MSVTPITRALLTDYEELHISQVCRAVQFTKDAHNHCAHFVNHVLGFTESLTCGQLVGRPGAAANIRVHEAFAHCPSVGEFEARPVATPCFAFVTRRDAVNLAKRTMSNIPKKHIGIYCDGEIWHYSNSARKVVRQHPADFAKHYAGAGFAVFFGTFPSKTRALVAPARSDAGEVAAQALQRGLVDHVDVCVWQQFLILRRLLFGPNLRALLDGNFGPMTEEATSAFQASAELPETGIVDRTTNAAAMQQGFVARASARSRKALSLVSPAMTAAAIDALHRLGSSSVFYTEEALEIDGAQLIARLEPHKHREGTQLRYWHRGITLYSSTDDDVEAGSRA